MDETKPLFNRLGDYAKDALAIGAVLSVILPVFAGIVATAFQNDIEEWIRQVGHTDQTVARLDAMEAAIKDQSLVIARDQRFNPAPALSFPPRGHRVESGAAGQRISFHWEFDKLRACGVPLVALFIQNGGGRVHRFVDVSILDSGGRGVEMDIGPGSIDYLATIPEDVEVGRGEVWVDISYPSLCPAVARVSSPRVPITIMPRGD